MKIFRSKPYLFARRLLSVLVFGLLAWLVVSSLF